MNVGPPLVSGSPGLQDEAREREKPTAPTRIPALTGLRAPTTVAIIAFHAQATVVPGATSSVEMFFVLSGFLITNLLMSERDRTGTVAFGRFLLRRVVRLVPVLLAVVIADYILLSVLLSPGTSDLAAQLRHSLTFTMDYYQGARPGEGLALGHLWSLAVEEKFYLLWPPVLLAAAALTRRNRMALALLVGNLAVLAYAEGAIRYQPTPTMFTSGFFEADTRSGGLLLGCFLALLLRARPDLASLAARPIVGIVGVAGLTLLIVWPQIVGQDQKQQLVLGLAVFGLSAFLLVSHLAQAGGGPVVAVFSWKPLVWMGDRSYAIYLWQLPVLVILIVRYHLSPLPAFLAGGAASLVLAQLIRVLVEDPLRPIQRRLARRSATGVRGPSDTLRGRLGSTSVRSRLRRPETAVWGLGCLTSVIAGVDAWHHTVDDGDIVLRFVNNATRGLGWVWNPGEHRNACTSFLHPALVLVVTGLGASAQTAAHLVGLAGLILAAVSAGLLLVRLGLPVAGVTAAAVLPVLPLWRETWGLETPLFVGLLLASAAALAGGRTSRLAVALVCITRPEGAALLVLSLLRRVNRNAAFVLTAAGPLLVALGLNYLVSGSALPASIGVKSSQGHSPLFSQPFPYLPTLLTQLDGMTHSRSASYALLLLAAAGLAGALATGRWALVEIAAFVSLQTVAYVFLKAPGYYWYYVPFLVVVALLAISGLEMAMLAFVRMPRDLRSRRGTVAGAVVGLVAIVASLALWLPGGQLGVQPREHAYDVASQWLKDHGPVSSVGVGEVGAYGVDLPAATIVDLAGLTTTPTLYDSCCTTAFLRGDPPQWLLLHISSVSGSDPASAATMSRLETESHLSAGPPGVADGDAHVGFWGLDAPFVDDRYFTRVYRLAAVIRVPGADAQAVFHRR